MDSQLLALPMGIISEILAYLDPVDLQIVMLSSQALRHLSAIRLYRHVRHEFLEIPGDNRESPIPVDKLAGILETLTTSDFNYAAFVKEIALDAAHTSPSSWTRIQSKIAYHFKYDLLCGRFLNSLLLAAIKRMTALESLRWDIKVQLNPSIFAVLGKSSSLKKLQIRMHSGRSIASQSTPSPAPSSTWPPESQSTQHLPPSMLVHSHGTLPSPSVSGLPTQNRIVKSTNFGSPARTFSHFKGLKSLAVLDMDSLEYISEISECISASATSLKFLRLSFSEKLALKSRKSTVFDPSDSESDTQGEDELDWAGYSGTHYPNLPSPVSYLLNTTITTSTSNNAVNGRSERLAQETVLSILFGLERKEMKPQQQLFQMMENRIKAEQQHGTRLNYLDDDKIDAMSRDLRRILYSLRQVGADSKRKDAEQIADKFREAADTFSQVAAEIANAHEGSSDIQAKGASGLETDLVPKIAAGVQNSDEGIIQSVSGEEYNIASNSSSSSIEPNPSHSANSHPEQPETLLRPVKSEVEKQLIDLVDMEHPDTLSEGDDQEFLECDERRTQNHALQQPRMPGKDKQPIRGSGAGDTSNALENRENTEIDIEKLPLEQAIQEYIRQHHGISLEELSVKLITLKPSVICQAVNVWSLKHICLLDVGPQKAFWVMLTALNKLHPLNMTSIHSDDTGDSLLHFLNSLALVDEVFLIEPNSRTFPGPTRSESLIDIDDIREMILEKHIKNLKRLMIRNDIGSQWNLDRRTARLIAKSGTKLLELVVAVDSSIFHFMMHYVQFLRSLVALHVLFSNDEFCTSLLNEIRLCAIDNILHFPALNIQYIAVSHASNGPVGTKACQIVKNVAKLEQGFNIDNTISPLSEVLLDSAQNSKKEQHGLSESSLNPAPSVDESEEDTPITTPQTLTITSIDLHNIIGVKIWEKKFYYSTL
ncbi:hypothetical protein LOZ12_000518 [Ophidiomyces ophidiicola]|uniref:Uncharacterized protein n=1 Tax=Ophidiomyces ophidiicola TaxID=1387563 RepID=A0ACB8V704_9EURO|nr:uncharacterized protein LOZ57_003414 [Ophidiomyces ophidiicola]KAI1926055.1 hypothetical protein LOZ64_000372 [Ophidiomyces ophidiicola]KAI1947176.1 hypothetical protein LOZ57_003414 [Ophidiomyces ophidiicola]KAI1955692.1 hypothetical protein LOZ62_000243 [Ophidiomyces ophidiicola]KAI1975988.1 hypothetical protein LOZ56_000305 [Ophidiomyces ophidiicola]KAI2011365.1 hypothetical protein LOZ50_000725 [Ophidiomyces ophidiicola]